MKKRQILNIVLLALLAALLVIEVVAAVAVLRLNMLPGLIVVLLVLLLLIYDCVVASFMFLRGRKTTRKNAKKMAKKRRIIACVLTVVMVCGCIVISTVANDVRKTFETMQADKQAEEAAKEENAGIKRAVYIRSHDAAQELADAKSYNFGIVTNYDDVCTQQAVDEIQKQLGSTIQTTGYFNVFEMADALLSGKLDAMILNSSYLSILEADDRYESFRDLTRVLAEVKIEGNGEELDGSGLLLNTEADIAENGKLKPFIVYLSGSDSREGTLLANTRSDVNILAVVNPETYQVLLVNSPRDFYVPNPAGDGAMDKLTHCGVYGIDCSIEALEQLYSCEVQYFAQMNFSGLTKLVDALGGITVESDAAFTLHGNVGKIKVGNNTLTGKQALAFARTRKGLDGGDNDRGKNQMRVIKAIIKQATSGATIVSNYSVIMKSIEGLFVMDVPTSLISEVVKKQLASMPEWNIVTYATTGKGGYRECFSAPGMELSTVVPNEASVSKATHLIEKVLAGEILTEQVVNTTI